MCVCGALRRRYLCHRAWCHHRWSAVETLWWATRPGVVRCRFRPHRARPAGGSGSRCFPWAALLCLPSPWRSRRGSPRRCAPVTRPRLRSDVHLRRHSRTTRGQGVVVGGGCDGRTKKGGRGATTNNNTQDTRRHIGWMTCDEWKETHRMIFLKSNFVRHTQQEDD